MTSFKPQLFILSAPSGTGKTTVYKKALEKLPNLVLSISHTTRTPRESMGEKNGVDYFFIEKEEFKSMIKKDQFLEWAEVHGNYYGTSKKFIEDTLKSGKNILLDIDIQGAMNIKKLNLPNARYIFLVPPSLDELERRLTSRGTETEESLTRRLGKAKHEISFKDQYDEILVNDNLGNCIDNFIKIINTVNRN